MTEKQNDPMEKINQLMAESRARDAANPDYVQFSSRYTAYCREWAKRDYWTLDEAANLLCGAVPKRPSYVDGQQEFNFQISLMQDRLKRANLTKEGLLTKRVLAKDVMAWAMSKDMQKPADLLDAMGIKYPGLAIEEKKEKPHGNTLKNQEKREKVLGAAMTALIKYPAQCMDRGEKYTGTQIAKVLEQNQSILFDDGVAPLAIRTMAELINKYLPK